ncbi:hypothetical protein JMUB7554_27870 [Staphylococcus aureus]
MVAVSLKKFFFFQAEDGIRDRSVSRGLGDVYKRQVHELCKKFIPIYSNDIYKFEVPKQ